MLARLRQILGLARRVARRGNFERDLDDEMRFHVEMQTAANVRRGLAPDAARERAEREFGSVVRAREEVRDARGLTPLDDLARDARFATRVLRRDPGFTTVAVLTLALGIGASTAVFSVVDGVLLRPLPFSEPDRLVAVYEAGTDYPRMALSGPNLIDWQAQSRRIEHFASYDLDNLTVLGGREPVRVPVAVVTGDFFQLLRVSPEVGRTFTADEMRAPTPTVALVSRRFWTTQLAGREPGAATLEVYGHVLTVVGVLPESFDFPERAQVWVPGGPIDASASGRTAHNYDTIARLAPGATVEGARAELSGIAARIKAQFGKESDAVAAAVVPLRDALVGNMRPYLAPLLGAVGFVLLVACVNLASAGLARGSARAREMAIRTALGASRARIARQLVTEHLILALTGGALGLLLAHWLVRALLALAPTTMPRAQEVGVDLRVATFAIVVAILAGLFIALFPVVQVAREALRDAMASGGRGSVSAGHGRLRRALVSAEVALALVLLVGAGLLIRSFRTLLARDVGLDTHSVLTAELALPEGKYATGDRRVVFYDAALARLRALPGVESVAMIHLMPLAYKYFTGGLEVEGRPATTDQERSRDYANYRVVSPGYFRTMHIPLLAGRELEPSDDSTGVHVTVINKAMADRMWPGQDPIGQRIRTYGMDQHPNVWMTVVGIVGNVRQGGLDADPQPEHYVSYRQRPDRAGIATLVMRTKLPPAQLAAPTRAALRALDPDVPATVATMDDIAARSVADRRFTMLVLSAFGAIALVLAAVGIYGVMSYVVVQRTREIGVRVALGAGRGSVVGLVTRDSMMPVLAGVVVGVAGAAALTRLMRTLLFGVSTTDATTFGAVVALLVLVALAASMIPARRAAQVDPLVALRSE
jgi:predicted permease